MHTQEQQSDPERVKGSRRMNQGKKIILQYHLDAPIKKVNSGEMAAFYEEGEDHKEQVGFYKKVSIASSIPAN